MLDRLVNLFTSLKLTVVCLALATMLVFIGTVAQVSEGLYNAQNRYFRSLLIYWTPAGTSLHIPVFPGGYLIGGVLLLNLVTAQVRVIKISKEKVGSILTHSGIVLLVLGQFATDLLQEETHMRLAEGESRNYSESERRAELAVVDTSSATSDRVFSFPENHLVAGAELRAPGLPFGVRLREYFPNSRLARRAPMVDKDPAPATQGIGKELKVTPMPKTVRMEERDMPTAIVELTGSPGAAGTWLVSMFLDDSQALSVDGKTYEISLRSARHYKPFSLELLKFSHDKYQGTDIPKNFSSRVRVKNTRSGEDREVLIYMNNPLRYGGETFYQSGFAPDNDQRANKVTILQVVRNPGWLTPYLACTLVSLGLTFQFMTHLIDFTRKRRAA